MQHPRMQSLWVNSKGQQLCHIRMRYLYSLWGLGVCVGSDVTEIGRNRSLTWQNWERDKMAWRHSSRLILLLSVSSEIGNSTRLVLSCVLVCLCVCFCYYQKVREWSWELGNDPIYLRRLSSGDSLLDLTCCPAWNWFYFFLSFTLFFIVITHIKGIMSNQRRKKSNKLVE